MNNILKTVFVLLVKGNSVNIPKRRCSYEPIFYCSQWRQRIICASLLRLWHFGFEFSVRIYRLKGGRGIFNFPFRRVVTRANQVFTCTPLASASVSACVTPSSFLPPFFRKRERKRKGHLLPNFSGLGLFWEAFLLRPLFERASTEDCGKIVMVRSRNRKTAIVFSRV